MLMFDRFMDGAIASATATLVSNPCDLMRSRLAVQGELQKRGEYAVVYKSLPQGMYRIARTEGLLALQKGLFPAMLWQFTQNGIRVGTYEGVKTDAEAFTFGSAEAAAQHGHAPRLAIAACAAGVCGFTGAVVASPFNMVKTRLQLLSAGAGAGVGRQYDYHNTLSALAEVWRAGGARALWRGCFVSGQREIVLGIAQMLTYDVTKRALVQRYGVPSTDRRVHAAAAVCGAAAIVAFTNPLTVVQVRMYNASREARGVYTNNLLATTWRVFRIEGVQGLYKGSTASFAAAAPHAIVTFMMLEWLREQRGAHSYSYAGHAADMVAKGNAHEYTWDSEDDDLVVLPP